MPTLLAFVATFLLVAPASSPLDVLTRSGRITALDGEVVHATDLRGRVVLIDVWATWCAPCLAEMPTLKRLHGTHGDVLRILGVSLDSLPRRDLRQWLARKDITWPQLYDGRGMNGPLAKRLNVEALPRSFLYDASGHLVATDLRGDALTHAVATLVARRPAR